jgi:hypothetical protein
MELMTRKESTTQLNKTVEIEKVWETVMRFLMENHHIEYIPFPSNEIKAWENLSVMERSNKVIYPDYKGPPTI